MPVKDLISSKSKVLPSNGNDQPGVIKEQKASKIKTKYKPRKKRSM